MKITQVLCGCLQIEHRPWEIFSPMPIYIAGDTCNTKIEIDLREMKPVESSNINKEILENDMVKKYINKWIEEHVIGVGL